MPEKKLQVLQRLTYPHRDVFKVTHIWSQLRDLAKKGSPYRIDQNTRGIFEQWSNELLRDIQEQGVIRRDPYTEKVFSSVLLVGHTLGQVLVFPYRLYFVEMQESLYEEVLDTVIAHPRLWELDRWTDFVLRRIRSFTARLKKPDVDIIKLSSKRGLSRSKSRILTNRELTRASGWSEKTIMKHRTFLLQNLAAINALYLIDHSKLGFRTVLVRHATVLPDDLYPFTLRCYQLADQHFFSILLLPPKSSVPSEVTAWDGRSYLVNWNLADLRTWNEESWHRCPRLLGDFTPGAIVEPTLSWRLNPKEPFTLAPHDAVILDHIQETTSRLEDIGHKVGVDASYVRQRIHKQFLPKGLILDFHTFASIGLQSTVVLVFRSENGEEVEGFVQRVQQFPYCEVFHFQQQQDHLISVALKVPSKWVGTIIDDIFFLVDQAYQFSFRVGRARIARWNLPLSPIWIDSELSPSNEWQFPTFDPQWVDSTK